MSIDSRQNEVSRYTREIAELKKKDATEQGKENSKSKEAERAFKSLSSAKSIGSINTHQNKLNRINGELAKISGKRADLAKKIAAKTAQLHRSEKHLARETEQQNKKLDSAQKRRESEQLTHQRKITSELRAQKQLMESTVSSTVTESTKYDVFISHASEDKESLVRPLAQQLTDLGHSVWFDETTLKVGDSLREKIDQGLSNSRYGIVVLSEAFFAKNWPQYELNGLVAKEMSGGKVILPIWHKVSKDEVLSYSPTLADKVALNTAILSTSDIAKELNEVLVDESS